MGYIALLTFRSINIYKRCRKLFSQRKGRPTFLRRFWLFLEKLCTSPCEQCRVSPPTLSVPPWLPSV